MRNFNWWLARTLSPLLPSAVTVNGNQSVYATNTVLVLSHVATPVISTTAVTTTTTTTSRPVTCPVVISTASPPVATVSTTVTSSSTNTPTSGLYFIKYSST